jgi:hypothetical protein
MKTIALIVIAALSSCVVPTDGANPLDRPQDFKSAAQLHEENIQAITSNPAYRLP